MKSIAKELGAWLLYILIIIGISYLVITFVGQRTQVSGSSMETTLSDGEDIKSRLPRKVRRVRGTLKFSLPRVAGKTLPLKG